MTDCSRSGEVRREVDRLVTDGLTGARHAALREHLRGCEGCRVYYESARRIEEALYPPAALSPASIDRLAELVAADPRPSRRAWWAILPALATAAAATLLWVRSDEDDFTPRGGGSGGRSAALSAFAIDPAAGAAVRLEDGAAVRRDTVVQLAYDNGGFAFAVVVGVDAHGTVQWYEPGFPGEGVALAANVHAEPMGSAWRIVAPAGPLRLFALFSERPVAPAAVQDAVTELRASGLPLAHAARLPGLAVFQDSLLFEVQP
jgi:hypothetical protein